MLVDPVEVDVAFEQSPQAYNRTGGSSRATASFSADRTLQPPPVYDPATGDYVARPADDTLPPVVPQYTRLRTHAEIYSRSKYTVYVALSRNKRTYNRIPQRDSGT